MDFFPNNYNMPPVSNIINGGFDYMNNIFNKLNEFEKRIKNLEQKIEKIENVNKHNNYPNNSLYMI